VSESQAITDVLVLWDHKVSIEIGGGPNPKLANKILDSVGYSRGAPDTPAAEVCARSTDPNAMPTPERLTKRLVLDRGNVTLDPLPGSDRVAIGAAHVWTESGPKQSFEGYRLILALYSSKLPARVGPNGSLTPTLQVVPAWVIYSAPNTQNIAGCGLWGVDVFDALTGSPLITSGYAPGP
jgi:hypothetical protein